MTSENTDTRRLSEESAQAAAMTRALPDRPAKRPGHPFPAVVAVITAAEIEHDFGGWLADVLRRAAAYVSSAEHPVMSRPGPWEAGQVTVLVTGTAGPLVESADQRANPDDQPGLAVGLK